MEQRDECPFCGITVDDDPGLEGLNTQVCRGCTENIHIYSPLMYRCYGEHTAYDIWRYTPTINDWDTEMNPVFVSLARNEKIVSVLDVNLFPPTEQDIIESIARSGSLTSKSKNVPDFEEVPVSELDQELLHFISPTSRIDWDENRRQVKQVRNRLPNPLYVSQSTVFTIDEQITRNVLTTETDNTEQMALTEL